jgi:hypothetical protein
MEDFSKDNIYPQTLNPKNKVKQKNLKIQMFDFIRILQFSLLHENINK